MSLNNIKTNKTKLQINTPALMPKDDILMEEADDEGSDHETATPRTTTKRKRNAIAYVKSTKMRLSDDNEIVGPAGSSPSRRVPVKKDARKVKRDWGPAASAHDPVVHKSSFDDGHPPNNISFSGENPVGNPSANELGSTTEEDVASEDERIMADVETENMELEAVQPDPEPTPPLKPGAFASEEEKIQWYKEKAAFIAQRPRKLCPSAPQPFTEPPEAYTDGLDFAYRGEHDLHIIHPLMSGQPAIEEEEEATDVDSDSQRVQNDVIVADLWQQEVAHKDRGHAILKSKTTITGGGEDAGAGGLKRKREPEELARNTRARVEGVESDCEVGRKMSRRRKRSSSSPASLSLAARKRRQIHRVGRSSPGDLIVVLPVCAVPAAPAEDIATTIPQKRDVPDGGGFRVRPGGATDGRLSFPPSPVPGEGPMGIMRMRNQWDKTIAIARRATAGVAHSSPLGPVRGRKINKPNRVSGRPRWEAKEFPKREIGDGHVEALRRYIISKTGRSPAVAAGRNVVMGVSFLFELFRLDLIHANVYSQSLAPKVVGARGVGWRATVQAIGLRWLGMEIEV